ncbi:MAG: polysaccharide pyruvyl transferase family protein [Candidatus Cyclobacteriaceae bacterium M3_2C_046]
MKRRAFNRNLGLISLGAFSGLFSGKNQKTKSPTFLIISGWQTENIGDIAHTPGLLALIDKYFPDAAYYLWPRDIEDYNVEGMLKKHFPKLKILKTNKPGVTDISMTDEIKAVFDSCDMLLHGSGPHVLENYKIKLWIDNTDKPFGVCGVTEQKIYPELGDIIEKSEFFFTRETASLDIVNEYVKEPKSTGFFPDATFNLNIHDEDNAIQIINKFNLVDKEFICIVPRLRYTPYYKIHDYVDWDQAKINEVNSINDKYKEIDHSKLRTVIINWVRETGKKVLLCPEMSYQIDIMKELLIDPLPEEVSPHVYKMDHYWITDVAASVYKRAFAVISMECHSPIISYANKTPAFYIRQKEDTIKGQMYYDIKLSDWVFEIDEVSGEDIYDQLKKLIEDEQIAHKKISDAYDIIHNQYQKSFEIIQHIV